MHARSMRTLIAMLATLALVGTMAALPVGAQLSEPECAVTADGTVTEEVTDAVTLTFDSDFVCPDAADAGTWSIVVDVSNESGADVTIDEVTLSHVTPGPDEGNELLTTSNLPLLLGPGAAGDFEAAGTFALAETDEGALANLHLRANGTATTAVEGEETDEVQPFVLGINVHVRGPGVELEDPEDGDGEDGEADGRPSWVPGPPPWVIEMMRNLFPEGFPPGFWMVVNRDEDVEGDEDTPAPEGEGGNEEGAGPPSFVTLPPQAGGDGDGQEIDAPPSWAPGPPPWAAGGADEADGHGGPPDSPGRP